MELHLVHKNLNKDDILNQNLVIAILFDYKDNKENKFLNDINLAEEKKINDASIADLINKNDPFYYYKGSLTTVPCTENVNWIVFKDIRSMSFEQFDVFKNWVENSNNSYYGVGYGNARGPKRLNGRKIYVENFMEENGSIGKYWFSILPITTFLMYPILIFYYHLTFKNR
jgi:carbonic anhydrase